MAPNNKRLEYESLKAVLQSLDPNIRLQLRLRVPSIRTVDKLLPLKIRHLSFAYRQMTLNNTFYHFATYFAGIPEKYKNGENKYQIVYTQCIQLTIQSPNGRGKMKRVVCMDPLSHSMEYIFSLIFPNRKLPIYVSEAIFERCEPMPNDINLKTKVIGLGLRTGSDWKNLIHDWALDTVIICMTPTEGWKLNQDFIRDARKLVIKNYNCDEGSWLRIIQSLKNPNIVLKYETHTDTTDDYIRFVKNLTETGKPIGTNLEFGFKSGETCMNLLDKMEHRLKATRKDDGAIILPMDNGSKLEVRCEKMHGLENTSQGNQSNWVIKIIIV